MRKAERFCLTGNEAFAHDCQGLAQPEAQTARRECLGQTEREEPESCDVDRWWSWQKATAPRATNRSTRRAFMP